MTTAATDLLPAADMSARLLETVASYGLLGSLHEWPKEPLPAHEFDVVLSEARRQRLVGLLTRAALDGRLPLSQEQEMAVDEDWTEAMRWNLYLERATVRMVDELTSRGIETRNLKGVAAAHLDYPDPAWRQSSDIDLLVRPDQIDAATRHLAEHGFSRPVAEPRPGFDRRFGKGATFVTETGLELDLHRTFAMGPFGLTIRIEDLWADAQPFRVAGHQLTALVPELRLVHACFHAALGDRVPRLVPQRDIAQLVLSGHADPVAVRDLARRWGCEIVLASAVRRAWRSLAIADATALSEWARKYQPTPEEVRMLGAYHRDGAKYAELSWLALKTLPLSERLSFGWSLAFPSSGRLGGRDLTLQQRVQRAARGWSGSKRRGNEPPAEESA